DEHLVVHELREPDVGFQRGAPDDGPQQVRGPADVGGGGCVHPPIVALARARAMVRARALARARAMAPAPRRRGGHRRWCWRWPWHWDGGPDAVTLPVMARSRATPRTASERAAFTAVAACGVTLLALSGCSGPPESSFVTWEIDGDDVILL